MSKPSNETFALIAMHRMFPPHIVSKLLSDEEIRGRLRSEIRTVKKLGTRGARFDRAVLFDAARRVVSEKTVVAVKDLEGGLHYLSFKNDVSKADLLMETSGQFARLSGFALLSKKMSVRVAALEELSSQRGLSASVLEGWRVLAATRAMTDDEVDKLLFILQETPRSRMRAIRSEIISGTGQLETMVPATREYYNQLVGTYNGSKCIAEHLKQNVDFFAATSKDDLLEVLPLCATSAFSANLDTSKLSECDIEDALCLLVNGGGNLFAEVGAIELGIPLLACAPALEQPLLKLIERVRDHTRRAAETKAISSIFILADGELAASGIFHDTPPFYRRFAALSQASLIVRELVNHSVDVAPLCEWALDRAGGKFFLQSLIDMRLEPRWNPNLASPESIWAFCLGRIILAASKNEDAIKHKVIHEFILGAGEDAIAQAAEFPLFLYPGPLDGTEDAGADLPPELQRSIERQLVSNEVSASSFMALVNSALLFSLGPAHTDLAAKALQLCNHRLHCPDNKSQLLAILHGLATVAATSRNPKLADEIRVMVRRYRADKTLMLAVDEAISVCIICAASHKAMHDWRVFAGDWLTELAFWRLSEEEGEVLEAQMSFLLEAVPSLWLSASKADAAVKAFTGSFR